ncbi:MAG: MGH1-like glycoside hydrolase domain-containing protein [Planctomycetota bacterium]
MSRLRGCWLAMAFWVGLGIFWSPNGSGDEPITSARSGLLDARALITQETFWDNRDVDWFAANIPLFECPDRELQTTWYYRWELITKHLTYGSPNSGYSFTEFIDRPFWSGTYGAISCPAGHQLYEVRWLRDPVYARDYGRYWLRTRGAQPRNYSTWLADAIWATQQVHPDRDFVVDLLPDLQRNYQGWEQRHFVPEVGLFWQTGHDDGMEFNINSRQTTDILRGAPGYRPTLNSYLWADARAIARVAELAGDAVVAEQYRAKAAALKRNLQDKLWDPKRHFFFHLYQRDEEAEGVKVKALSLTHQTGRHAGSEFGRELIGYVPWQFGLPDADRGFEQAWGKLMSKEGFAADFGPTTVERNDPMFLLKESCCWWSGQSWPYATSQTLKALANLLQGYDQSVVTPADYYSLLSTYSRTHRKEGRPYLAEACHPDTGSFAGHDGYNHSEHYFHSSFNDLIITGLVGLRTRDDDRLELRPLAPAEWDYFALDQVPYRGHLLTICWDRDGQRYGRGPGFRVFADGREIASAATLGPLEAQLPLGRLQPASGERLVNFAVNNDGTYYPRLSTSWSNSRAPASKLVDGNYWYHRDPPNRWTCEGSEQDRDWVEIDLGMERELERVRLYFLDDGAGVVPPQSARVEYWDGTWKVLGELGGEGRPAIQGHLPSELAFAPLRAGKVRLELVHAKGGKSGLTEIELLGRAKLPVEAPPHPAGNLAYRSQGSEWPKASASHADRFGGRPELANDGLINFLPTPTNRWTSYESGSERDWLEIDCGKAVEFRRIELAIYDDRGGVQAPQSYELEVWDGTAWQPVDGLDRSPAKPVGGEVNIARFAPRTASKLRVWFKHAGQARSGVTELLVWND